ncbi:hypothetical protein C8F01DRAFT_1165025 [Mycena amicta]|nr:hypothetical protein C8F01DRAFT_1165025 [Mycena amicta]
MRRETLLLFVYTIPSWRNAAMDDSGHRRAYLQLKKPSMAAERSGKSKSRKRRSYQPATTSVTCFPMPFSRSS